jgi:anti-sigma-K factor RskA
VAGSPLRAIVEEAREPQGATPDPPVEDSLSQADVPDDVALEVATEVEQRGGVTGPTNWWRMGLIAVAIVAAILLALQLMAGNTGTEMIPGTPTAAPQGAPPTGQ